MPLSIKRHLWRRERSERLIEVPNEVFGIFEAYREANKSWRDAHRRTLCRAEGDVRRVVREAGERLDPA
jgi:hypothetical protein